MLAHGCSHARTLTASKAMYSPCEYTAADIQHLLDDAVVALGHYAFRTIEGMELGMQIGGVLGRQLQMDCTWGSRKFTGSRR